MPSRRRRVLIVLTLIAVAAIYTKGATHFEQQTIAAQAPVVATTSAAARHVDRELLMKDIRTLADPALEGRRTGTAGGLKARAWVEAQFAAIGLMPAGSSGYLQPFAFTHNSVRGFFLPGRPFRTNYSDAANVIGKVAGSKSGARAIVVSAHYDHVGVRDGVTYPGADDNASGVAVLLAVARQLRASPPGHPVVLVAFDAEELGLRGAEALVGSPLLPASSVALDVNLDMVSRSDDNEIFASGTYQTPSLRPILNDVQRRSAVKILFGHDRPMVKAGSVDDWTDQSDHGVFHAAGIPFVYFGVVDHADYHQPTDTVDKIDPRFFGDVADMIVEAVVALDRSIP
jgi:Zn-dependent M28 family amino/carboxypeptidase